MLIYIFILGFFIEYNNLIIIIKDYDYNLTLLFSLFLSYHDLNNMAKEKLTLGESGSSLDLRVREKKLCF